MDKWLNYYREMFVSFQSDFIDKVIGDSEDINDYSYEESYRFELFRKREEFAQFMCLFNKYNLKYDKNAIAMYIINLFKDISYHNSIDGARIMSDLIIDTIKKESSINNISCPK